MIDIAVPVIHCCCQRRDSMTESDCFLRVRRAGKRSHAKVDREEAWHLGKNSITKSKKKNNAKERVVRSFKCCQKSHTQDIITVKFCILSSIGIQQFILPWQVLWAHFVVLICSCICFKSYLFTEHMCIIFLYVYDLLTQTLNSSKLAPYFFSFPKQ